MLNLPSLLSAFARAYMRQLGRTAARRTSWLAIPVLILVALLALWQMGQHGVNLAHVVGPLLPLR